jgi:hypothetical protein
LALQLQRQLESMDIKSTTYWHCNCSDNSRHLDIIYNFLALQLQRQLKVLIYNLQLIGTACAIAAPTIKALTYDLQLIGTAIAAPTKE